MVRAVTSVTITQSLPTLADFLGCSVNVVDLAGLYGFHKLYTRGGTISAIAEQPLHRAFLNLKNTVG